MMKTQQTKGYFMVFIAGCLWGTNGMFSSWLREQGAESSTIAFLRLFTGALMLIPIMIIMAKGTNLFKIDKKGMIASLALGVFSQGLFNFTYAEAIAHVGVATSSVLAYTSPIFVCIMARIFFKENITPIKVLALVINIFGCTLTVTGGDFTAIQFSVYGAFMAVAAGFLYGLMTIISATTGAYHPLSIMFYSFVFGAAALAIIGNPWGNIVETATPTLFVTAAGYGLFATIGAYFIFMQGLKYDLEASKVPVVSSVETIVAAISGVFLFSESIGGMKLVGMVMVLASIAIMNLVKPKKEQQDRSEEDQEREKEKEALA